MAGPAGFADLINRKYDIQQQEATGRSNLENAQATSITAKTPFENALQAAQTAQTAEQTKTVQPLANASIAGTLASAGEAGARSNLFGAQTREINENELGTVNDVGLQSLYRGLQHFSGAQATGANSAGGVGSGNGVTTATGGTLASGAAITAPATAPVNVGTGAASLAGNPAAAPLTPGYTGGIALLHPDEDVAPDRPLRTGFAEGTTEVKPVPKPGDTQTSGTWGAGQNQTLRDRIFPGAPKMVEGYKKGTAAVKGKSTAGGKVAPPQMLQPQASMPAPGQVAPAMPGSSPPMSPAGGLAALLQAAMGMPMVPGKPTPPGAPDTVPAMLTPGEAVVNKQAVKHIPGGRPAIAKANAKGVAEQRGAPMQRKPMAQGMKPKVKPAGNHVAIHVKMA